MLKNNESIFFDKSNVCRVPTTLMFFACAYVISAIAFSNMPEWNYSVRAIAAVYVIIHFLFMIGRQVEFVKPNAVHVTFLIWSFLSVVGGYDTLSFASLIQKIWTVLQLIILSYFLYALAIHRRSVRWLEWSFLIGVFLTLIWVFITTGGHFGAERLSGTKGNANLFAFILLLSCVISLDLLKHCRSIILKSTLLCNLGIIFPFLLASGSRKGIIGFFLLLCMEVIHSIFLHRREKRVRSIVFGATVIVLTLTVCLPMLYKSSSWDRLLNLERFAKGESLVVQEKSLSGRLELYTRGFELALQRPFFGVGLDMFRYYDSTFMMTDFAQTYSHSNFIEVLANTGFLGFSIYYYAYALIVFRLISARKKIRDTSLFGNYVYLTVMIGVIVIVYDLFSVTYYVKEYWLAMTIVLSSTEFIKRQYNQKEIQRLLKT